MTPPALVTPLLALDEVTFAYRRRGRPDRQVLRGISLNVSPGELVVLLGPNGSGKTTLLRVARGVLPAGQGAVAVDGRPVADWTRR
ncbi:MAG TPA: ABC transporter ATP-binding protein, partial [Acidimicrobiales bacterium]